MSVNIKIKNHWEKLHDNGQITATAYEILIIYINFDERMVGNPYCISKNKTYPLIKDNINGNAIWKLPYHNDKLGLNNNLKPTQGDITIEFSRENKSKFSANIHIIPSVFTEDDFYKIVKEIGILALNHHSFTKSSRNLRLTKKTFDCSYNVGISSLDESETKDIPFLDELDKLIDLIDIFVKSGLLRSNSMVIKNQTFPIEKSNTPQNLIQRKINPSKRFTSGKIKSYHHDSPENQWLKYIINFELESYISNQMSIENYNNKFQYELRADTENKLIIEKISLKLRKIKSNIFFNEVSLKNKSPKITTKLLKSNGYSQIYSSYKNIFTEDISNSFKLNESIKNSYGKGYLHNLSNIYELWCLFTIDNSLRELGFSGESLFKSINFTEAQIRLDENTEIILSKKFSKGIIKCHIYYEKKIERIENGKYYKPDIIIKITAPKRLYGLESFTIILDSKYKDFTKRTKNNDIVRETLEVAMYKYHKCLRVKPDASYIIHPVNDIKYHWIGSESFSEFLRNKGIWMDIDRAFEDFNLNHPTYTEYVSHKFAALPLRPNNIALDIRRLFTLIFHYHIGLTSLCLGCGRELCEDNEFYVNNFDKISSITKSQEKTNYHWNNFDPSTSFRAVCKGCQNEWRISFCSNKLSEHGYQPNKSNRIVKIGKSDNNQINWFSIHNRDELGNTGCPTCGIIFNTHQKINNIHQPIDNDFPF